MSGTPASSGYRMPAEWEEHEATWISWPKNQSTFPSSILPKVEQSYVGMVNGLAPYEEVRILVDDEKMEQRVRSLLPSSGNVAFYEIRTVDVWVRDYGPTYLKNHDRALVKWRFNAWGKKYDDLLPDEESGERIASTSGLPVFRPGIVLEGGSIDVDGEGTLMTTEQCLLNPNRNPGLEKDDIEDLLEKYLSAKKVIWLGFGVEGDDTDGHIDDLARFVEPRRVVLAAEGDLNDPNHDHLSAAMTRLMSSTDSKGWELEITTMPMPPPQSTPDGRLPASHLNFYIGNGAVLLPAFGGDTDRQAAAVLQDSFPDREVIPIDCRALVNGLGTIHCVTQQVPR